MSVFLKGSFDRFDHFAIKLFNVLPLALDTVAATSVTSTTATLLFPPAVNAETYEVSLDNGATWAPLASNGSLTGLSGNTTYSGLVRGANRYGKGPARSFTIATPSPYAVFSSTRRGSNMFVSSDGLDVWTTNSSSWKTVLSSIGYNPGPKLYAEFTVGVNTRIGLANDGVNLQTEIQTTGWPCLSNRAGEIYLNGSVASNVAQGVNYGDVVMMAWNGTRLYFGRNGSWLNGAPDSNMGLNVASRLGTGKVYVAVSNTGAYTEVMFGVRANFGQNGFRYAPPTGYTHW